jgi:hypothetical protein
LPNARRFGEETSGWRAATYSWRNHAVMISKVPNDVLKLHQVRNFYKDRKAKLKVIILVRDPRDVLTSKMKAVDLVKYATDLQEWRDYHAHVRLYLNDPDVLLLRYEDLVSDTDGIQRRIDAFTGEPTERPMKDFHKADRSDFDTTPLNGVRPVDRNTVGRWATAEHATRIEQILREVPDFPQILRDLGYEQDDSWVDRWKAGVGK